MPLKILLKKSTYFIIIVSIMFLSCNNETNIVNSEKIEPVSIFFDSGKSSLYNELFKNLIDEFNKENPYEIFVSLYNDNGSDNILENPDCTIVSAPEAKQLYKNHQIIDLSTFLRNPLLGLEGGSDFFCKAVLEQIDFGIVRKKIISIPLFIDSHFFLYNRDILSETSYARLPKSWFRLNLLFRKAGKQNEKVFGFVYNFDNLVKLIQARGGSILQPAKFNYSFNNPVVINTIRYLKQMERKNILSVNNLYSNQQEFAFGKLLMVMTEIRSIDYYADLINTVNPGMSWDTELIVTRKPGDNVVLSCNNNFVILEGQKNKEIASWLFIKWLLDLEQQKKIVQTTKALPANLSLIPEIKKHEEIQLSMQWLNAARLAYYSKKEAMPFLYDYDEVSIQFDESLKKIRSGRNILIEILKLEHRVKKKRRTEKYIKITP